MNTRRISCLPLIVMAVSPLLLAAIADGNWLRSVPPAARTRTNPLVSDTNAALAGAHLYHRDCASCHGAEGAGRGSRPTLRSERVHSATDGELEWLLTNGNLAHGMPEWSKLPEAERWQIVAYLRTIPADAALGAATNSPAR